MTEFSGVLHGADQASQGRDIRFQVTTRTLRVLDPAGDPIEVPFERIRSRVGGWEGDLFLEWDEATGTRALVIGTPELRRLIANRPPEAFVERLRPWRQQRASARRGRRVVVLVAGLALLTFGFALVSSLTHSGRLADAAVERIPVAWEEELGRSVQAQMTAGAVLWTDGEPARVVEEIGSRLARHVESPYTFRFHLVDDPRVNAMAMPGGFITVYTGLVRRAETPEELAAVLAHEIQHVVERHSLRALVRGLGLRVTLGILLGGTGVLDAPVAGMIEHLAGLRFSRHQELEADLEGVRLLQRAGIGTQGMILFFERLSQSTEEIPEFLSTHPAGQERVNRLQNLIQPSVQTGSLDYDWDRVQAELAGARP